MEKKSRPDVPVEVVVSRAKWGRGESSYSGLLIGTLEHVPDHLVGKMCCLGFVARRAGLRASDIEDVVSYDDRCFLSSCHTALSPLGQKLYKKFPKLFRRNGGGEWTTSAFHDEMTRINDDAHLREDIREQRLCEVGLRAGIHFTFVD